MLMAFCACSSFGEPTKTVPSSSMSMLHPVSSMIERITLPPGPMTAPILSCGDCDPVHPRRVRRHLLAGLGDDVEHLARG